MCVCACVCVCVPVWIFLEGSEEWVHVCLLIDLNRAICCVVINTMLYDAKEKRIQSVFNDEHVSVCSVLL